MFRALVERGRELEQKGELPPPGFYHYSEPIRWKVHLWPDRVHLERSEHHLARPRSGRTSKPEAHILTDEASYALGVAKMAKGGTDKDAEKKHGLFLDLIDTLLASGELQDDGLREAVGWAQRAIKDGDLARQQRYEEMTSKEWVSFEPREGKLKGTQLFQHPDARTFWSHEMGRRTASTEAGDRPGIVGSCAVCGQEGRALLRKLPLNVKLIGTAPLHSLNADAYTSFIGGASTAKKAHLGLCFECGETAARAFNHLSASVQHRRDLYRHPTKQDSLVNQIALFWTKAPAPVVVGDGRMELDLNDPTQIDWGAILRASAQAPPSYLDQLADLLTLPWNPRDSALYFDPYRFYLAVLSPNVGRIAVRDWISDSLFEVKDSLAAYLQGVRIVSPKGDSVRPISLAAILDALGDDGADLKRALLRTAYTGIAPPPTLVIRAGQRLNHLFANQASLRERQQSRRRDQRAVWKEGWPQALAAAIKLGLFHKTEEATTMTEIHPDNPLYRSKAFHCGRLFAVLDVAQRSHHFQRYGKPLKTSLVARSYGGAVTSPAPTLGALLKVATMSHMPGRRKEIKEEVERIASTIVELGGLPPPLSLTEQAEFGLGLYHQRARSRVIFASIHDDPAVMDADEDESDDELETTID